MSVARRGAGARRARRPPVSRVSSGLDQLRARPRRLAGQRLGLLVHAASVTADLRHAPALLHACRDLQVTTLFGPEHGLWADAQDLIEVEDSRDPGTGLPVYSLYGRSRVPSAERLAGLDTLVVDLQDVGSRYYTFIWTLLHALVACAEHRKRVVVLDRPNPLGGEQVDGNLLDLEYRSFVGLHPLPVRHGMTIGELALLFRDELALDVDLEVVTLRGWRRAMTFEDTGLPWVLPSPNMPTVDTAWVYPGGCLIEGTNLSEGRGTTRPFELVGAPWLDAWALQRALESERLAGVRFRPCVFTPTFQKHAGLPCGGVQVHVTDRARFSAFLTYLLLIHHARAQDPQRFAWRQPPYEYEYVKLPIDILCGGSDVRRALEAGRSPRAFMPAWRADAARFRRRRAPYLLYT